MNPISNCPNVRESAEPIGSKWSSFNTHALISLIIIVCATIVLMVFS